MKKVKITTYVKPSVKSNLEKRAAQKGTSLSKETSGALTFATGECVL